MPKTLKDDMRELLLERAKELNAPDFVDKIADETIATNIEELLTYLEKVKHPALTMPPIM
jgi:acetyl-CoA synthase